MDVWSDVRVNVRQRETSLANSSSRGQQTVLNLFLVGLNTIQTKKKASI